jgi:hypothetical protein
MHAYAQVGDDPIKLARFHAIQTASDALTKGRAEYDKSIENQELNELTPRCYGMPLTLSLSLHTHTHTHTHTPLQPSL